MAIEYAKLMSMRIPEMQRTYTARDTMLYALAVGLGRDPMDRRELSFVLEDGLRAVPTMAPPASPAPSSTGSAPMASPATP